MKRPSDFASGRREFIRRSLVTGASLVASNTGIRVSQAKEPHFNPLGPVVRTAAGRVRGVLSNGVNTFKGIPYGSKVAGGRRFLPADKPTSWEGVREAQQVGLMAVQKTMTDGTYAKVLNGLFPSALYMQSALSRMMGEDCLYLNVWSRQLGKESQRPVMVWMHPGSFNSWAGYSEWTDGANLARKRDVVIVSLNHRLNIFGHLYLGEFGEAKYADSGNVGMLDIIAALGWVQENIASFGGNPDNITVFGESGGAYKVDTLLAMPASKGLLHKAIVQSSALNRTSSREVAAAATRIILSRLNISPGNISALEELPTDRLLSALGDDLFYPVVAGDSLPRQPFDPDAPSISAAVPLLIGVNKDEWAYGILSEKPPEIVDTVSVRDAVVRRLWRLGVDEAQACLYIEAYRALHSPASPMQCYSGIVQNIIQEEAIIQAERKLEENRARCFMYLFAWEAPGFEGKYKSCHTFDVPFVFDNVDAAPQLYGPNPDPRRYDLAESMSKAWAAFAHDGDPSHPGLPHWKPYSSGDRSTMLLSYACELKDDPQREDRLAFEPLRASRIAKMTTWKSS
jgi:para-nitrobenzyl esterase